MYIEGDFDICRIAQGDGGRQKGRLTRLGVSSWTRRDQATP